MERDEQVQLIWDRFVHRTSAYAIQKEVKGRYTFRPVAYCPKACGIYPCPHRVERPLTTQEIEKHLDGEQTIGLYSTREDNTVKWLCIDVDEMNTDTVMDIAMRVVARFGKRSCLVEFSGGRGYHIWLFFAQPVPAQSAWLLGNILIGEHKVEIYPRQMSVNGLGNLVKLPLGIQRKTGKWCLFQTPAFVPYEDQWEALARVKLIDDLGDLPQPEPRAPGTSDRTLPCMANMMEEGLDEGARDSGLFRLSCYWRAHNIPEDLAVMMAHAVNRKGSAPLDNRTVEEKVASAYTKGYKFYPCQERTLDSYCESSCPFFTRKAQTRGVSPLKLVKQVRK